MFGYMMKRILQLMVTMFGVVTLVFFALRLLPGDATAAMAGDNLSGEALERLREQMGLDAPLYSQYLSYLGSLVRFEFGNTLITNLPVMEMLMKSMPITMLVALITIVLAILISIPLGTLAAFMAHKGKKTLDNIITWTAMIVDLMPAFWTSLLLLLILSLSLGIFPASGAVTFEDPVMLLKRIAIPVIVLTITQLAILTRMTRTAVLEVLNEDYIRTARSLGMSEILVVFRHALKNAALPIVTVLGISFGNLLNGTVIVEFIFSIPGLGTLLVNGIYSRDYPLVQTLILFYAFIFIVVNFLTDIVYKKIDPRVQF